MFLTKLNNFHAFLLREGEDETGGGGSLITDIGGDDTASAGDDTLAAGDDSVVAGEGEDTPAPAKPVTLEALTLPENLEFPEEVTSAFLETLNDENLSRAELGQKLLDMQSKLFQESAAANEEKAQELYNSIRDNWKKEAEALPDIGGAALPQTLTNIKKGLTAAGATKETYEALDLTGAGDNPHIIKLLNTLTKPFLENPPAGGTPPKGSLSQAERLFGGNKT